MKLSRVTVTAFIFAIPCLAAKTHIVNNVSGNPTCTGTFTSIQAAIDASASGDTVYVCASGVPYNEQLTISTSIILAGETGATLQPSAVVPNFTLYAVPTASLILVTPPSGSTTITVTIAGLIVDGINNGINNGCGTGLAGITYLDASGTIVHNTVKNIQLYPFASLGGCQQGLAIWAESTGANANGQTVAITQNSLHDYDKGGIVVSGTGMQAPIKYNTVQGVGPTAITAQNGIEVDNGTGEIVGNTVFGHSYTGGGYIACDILTFSDGLNIESNSLGLTDVGIYSTGNSATITGNIVYATTFAGGSIIFADGSATSNTVTNSAYEAFEYYGSSNASLTRNTIIDANIGISNDNDNALVTTGTKYFDVLTPMFAPTPTPGSNVVFTGNKNGPARLHASPFGKH